MLEGEVAQAEQYSSGHDSRAGPPVIDKHADGHTHRVHAQVAGESDQVAFCRREVQAIGILRCPSAIDILMRRCGQLYIRHRRRQFRR